MVAIAVCAAWLAGLGMAVPPVRADWGEVQLRLADPGSGASLGIQFRDGRLTGLSFGGYVGSLAPSYGPRFYEGRTLTTTYPEVTTYERYTVYDSCPPPPGAVYLGRGVYGPPAAAWVRPYDRGLRVVRYGSAPGTYYRDSYVQGGLRFEYRLGPEYSGRGHAYGAYQDRLPDGGWSSWSVGGRDQRAGDRTPRGDGWRPYRLDR